MKRKIGVIGSGAVGQALATGFLKYGYQVMIGSRDLSKLEEWKSKASSGGSVGSFAETAQSWRNDCTGHQRHCCFRCSSVSRDGQSFRKNSN